jgi:hypothetical protein
MMIPDAWLGLIRQHLSWYPLMELSDVYKLLYQGVMGSEHMMATQQEFSRRLKAEFEIQPPGDAHLVLELIHPGHILFRLNLRPYKVKHSSIEPLIPAMLATTKLVVSTLDDLRSVWLDFTNSSKRGDITNFTSSQLDEFSGRLKQQDYPPLHHSEAYAREYQPAYRLIASEFLAVLGLIDEG